MILLAINSHYNIYKYWYNLAVAKGGTCTNVGCIVHLDPVAIRLQLTGNLHVSTPPCSPQNYVLDCKQVCVFFMKVNPCVGQRSKKIVFYRVHILYVNCY